MDFKRIFGIAILAVGIILFAFGINSTNKVGEQIVEEVKGRYTDTTMWYLIGGVILIVIGGVFVVIRRR